MPKTNIHCKEQERHLLARVARGEVRAIRTLMDRYTGRAMSVAFRILRDRTNAEDIVQETFIELWQRSGDFDAGRGSPASWVMTIARSRAIDRLRADGRASRALGAAGADLQPAAVSAPDELEDLRRDYRRVHTALDALTPPQRRAVYLAYFDGLSQIEIAHKTGIPLGTAKLHRRKAMANLSRLLRLSRRAPALRSRSAGMGAHAAPKGWDWNVSMRRVPMRRRMRPMPSAEDAVQPRA